MTVRTAADEARDRAREGVKDAISALNEIVVEDCWGARDFSPEYRAKLSAALSDLIKVNAALV